MDINAVARDIIHNHCYLPEGSFSKIVPLFKASEIDKGDVFIRENGVSRDEIMLVSGIVRGFYTGDAAGDHPEVNVSFYHGYSILTPWCIRTINQKSIVSYQALDDVQIITFDAVEFRKLINQDDAIQLFAKTVMQNEMKQKMQREQSLCVDTAAQRYLHFREQYPDLENKISQYHIASFLGITPISLSRIRKELSLKYVDA